MRKWRLLSPRTALRALAGFAAFSLTIAAVWLWQATPHRAAPLMMPESYEAPHPVAHPIDYLMNKAFGTHQMVMEKQTTDLPSTAAAYRRRRGRHPPPGFDKWVQFAKDHDAIIVEDFFDQIYHDLTPFWGIDAKEIRQQAKHFSHVISIRNGNVTMKTDPDRPWMDIWSDLITDIQEWLPDVDIPINVMDESRVIVPWEDVDRYAKAEQSSRKPVPPKDAVTQLAGLRELDEDSSAPQDIPWITEGSYWDLARAGCAPGSPSRNVSAATDFTGPPPELQGFPEGSFQGYVANWTWTKDPCLQPDLRESHGTFIEPISLKTTKKLVPVFGGSKLPFNNDILIPPAMYWSNDVRYSGGENHGGAWEKKMDKVMWRGIASGGRNRENTWTRFHRHRFVSMLNGTAVQMAEGSHSQAYRGLNFNLQSYRTYHLAATHYSDLGEWLARITDVGMTDLACFPGTGNFYCPYTDPYFKVVKAMAMKSQYAYKLLPDIDGNSFSGRYRGFLLSTSLPIKATIYSEWHDSRLVPWLHFVPMQNSFVDVYGILDYFLGVGTRFRDKNGVVLTEGAHDKEAKLIAMTGKEWAEKVLRREDMLIYVMRLLMEFARLSDDSREKLGFVDDLKE